MIAPIRATATANMHKRCMSWEASGAPTPSAMR
jgi:hypothetical protein